VRGVSQKYLSRARQPVHDHRRHRFREGKGGLKQAAGAPRSVARWVTACAPAMSGAQAVVFEGVLDDFE